MSRSKGISTIWYSHGGGRFGNQMLRFAHLIAWVEEHRDRIEVINLAVWPYINLVDGYEASHSGLYPPRRSWLDPLASITAVAPEKVGRGLFTAARERVLNAAGEAFRGKPIIRVPDSGPGVDLADPAFLERCTRSGGAWLIGWKIASWDLVRKHGDAIRRHLAIRQSAARPGYDLAAQSREGSDMLIGVLCRQTDYRVYQQGRFFLEQSQTAAHLKSIAAMYPNRRVRFLISGDEPISTNLFAGLDIIVSTGSQGMGGHFVESIAALSRCDLVVGPPSTFAAWAAFLGRVPYLPILPNRPPLQEHVLHDALADAAADPECSLAVM
jgi:hypothetical protein